MSYVVARGLLVPYFDESPNYYLPKIPDNEPGWEGLGRAHAYQLLTYEAIKADVIFPARICRIRDGLDVSSAAKQYKVGFVYLARPTDTDLDWEPYRKVKDYLATHDAPGLMSFEECGKLIATIMGKKVSSSTTSQGHSAEEGDEGQGGSSGSGSKEWSRSAKIAIRVSVLLNVLLTAAVVYLLSKRKADNDNS